MEYSVMQESVAFSDDCLPNSSFPESDSILQPVVIKVDDKHSQNQLELSEDVKQLGDSIHAGDIAFKFKCSLCGISLKTQTTLDQHLKTHTDERPSKCDICGKAFLNKSYLHQHQKVHDPDPVEIMCPMCDKSFKNIRYLNKHLRIHTAERIFQCKLCHYKSFERARLVTHMRSHNGEKPFECDLCDKKYTSRYSLKMHRREHSMFIPKFCQLCNKQFRSFSGLKKHVIRQHPKAGEINFHRCEECGKPCGDKILLKAHMRVHIHDKPFLCNECGKTFKSSHGLEYHKEVLHLGIKRYSCQDCGRQFSARSNLLRHIVSHSGVKSCTCSTCGKSFACVANLEQHEVIHSGVKMFKCHLCDKSYSWKAHLTGHVRTFHEGIRAHQCKQCSKAFSQRSGLRLHMRSVHGTELPYSPAMRLIYGSAATTQPAESDVTIDTAQSAAEPNQVRKIVQPVKSTKKHLSTFHRPLSDPKLQMKPIVVLKFSVTLAVQFPSDDLYS